MMIVMKTDATREQVQIVVDEIQRVQLTPHIVEGVEHTIIGAVGDGRGVEVDTFQLLPGVERVTRISRPYKLASREFHPEDSVFPLDGIELGTDRLLVVAGPCAVENRKQYLETAEAVKAAGATALRGGVFKPRSSPYSFQGLGEAGLELLAEARELTGLPVIAEVLSPAHVPVMQPYVDAFQIGARNMQNFALLHEVGASQHPVIIKRGMSATIEELLMAAEYVLSHGNRRVALCERGIRTFETATRNTTDINAIPVLKSLTHLPILLDPSHATGKTEYVPAIARAAIAAGADGLMVEVHPDPEHALSDGAQSIRVEDFKTFMSSLEPVAHAVGRTM